MKIATIRSVCECQAALGAELTERRLVARGWAKNHRSGKVETAPAHSIHAEHTKFQVGWQCPFCTRNVLRSFDAGSLVYTEAPAKEAAVAG